MKKNFIMTAAAIMAAAALSACSAQSGTETKADTQASSAAAGTETKEEASTEAGSGDTQSADTETKAEAGAISGAGVAAEGKLVMATNAEFPPYEYHDANTIVGIDVDIMSAIAEKMGLELVVVDTAFDSIILEVSSGKADIGAAGMTVTEDRLMSVDFSDTYAKASQMIIVKSDSEIAGPADLEGKTVGVQLGTTGDIFAGDIKDVTVERYNKGFEAVQSLTQGKIDAVIIDAEPAKIFVKETEGIKVLDEAFTEEEYAIAIKKGNTELLNNINAALAELKEEGKIDEIIAKYIKAE